MERTYTLAYCIPFRWQLHLEGKGHQAFMKVRIPEGTAGKIHSLSEDHTRCLLEAPSLFFAVRFEGMVNTSTILEYEPVLAGREGYLEGFQRNRP